MDKQMFILLDWQRLKNAVAYIEKLPLDGSCQIDISEVKKDKTLKQLGAVFGVWVKFLAQEYGESENEIHRWLKARFLARIYFIEPMTPAQETWVELMAMYQQAGEQEKLEKHAKRISLAWAKLPQMKSYMSAIEQHYQAKNKPLPVIDKFWKYGK